MPRGEGGYKSRNKTKDGKNKSWIGFNNGKVVTKYADGYEKGEDGAATKKKAPAKKKAAAKAKPSKSATKTSVRPPAGRPAAKSTPTSRRKSTGGRAASKAATTTGSAGRRKTRGAKIADAVKKVVRPKSRSDAAKAKTKSTSRRKSSGGVKASNPMAGTRGSSRSRRKKS